MCSLEFLRRRCRGAADCPQARRHSFELQRGVAVGHLIVIKVRIYLRLTRRDGKNIETVFFYLIN